MDQRAQLKFLLVMAASDGGLAQEELHMLSDRAKQFGLGLDEFEQIVNEVTGGSVELTFPESKEDRMTLLTDVIRMMGADGELHEKEKNLFALMAAQMEITQDDVNLIVDRALGDS
jgi:uncharacterized tellurite resistance protein B-like protein